MVDYKFILSFMKGVLWLLKMKILWIRYANGYDENFHYFIDILP